MNGHIKHGRCGNLFRSTICSIPIDLNGMYLPYIAHLYHNYYAEIDPNRRQLQSRQDHSIGERSRYMKLKTKEEKCPDGYTKPLRARSLDGKCQ